MVPRVGDVAVALRRFAPFRAIFPALNDALRELSRGGIGMNFLSRRRLFTKEATCTHVDIQVAKE